MSKFEKLLEHPEKDKIISKLVEGETPKDVSQYLKLKYAKPEESHLRLPANLLKSFVDTYMNEYESLNKIIEDEKKGRLNKNAAESLLNNKTWQKRVAELADDTVDIKKKIAELLHIIEQRAQQLFDSIQENPEGTKKDYVLLQYLNTLMNSVEKYDKIINEKPDQTIQHNISVQMVEEHSLVFQDAIREVLLEMGPETSSKFMDLLNNKLEKIKAPQNQTPSPKEQLNDLNKIEAKLEGNNEQ